MNAEGGSGDRWVRRLSVLVALITTAGLGAGLAVLVAPSAGSAYVRPEPDNQPSSPAHFEPWYHLDGYTHDSDTCDYDSRKDPINVIFVGPFGEYPFVDVHASDSSHVHIFDVNLFKPAFFSSAPGPPYQTRLDLKPDSKIDIFDVNRLKPFFFLSCTP